MAPQENKLMDTFQIRLLRKLSRDDRKMVAMNALGFTHREVGEWFGITMGGAKNRYSRISRRVMTRRRPYRNLSALVSAQGMIHPLLADRIFCALIPGLPPTANTAYPNFLRGRFLSKKGKEWKALSGKHIGIWKEDPLNASLPLEGATAISVLLHLPRNFGRDGELKVPNWDTDNRKKMVLDSLTDNGIWPDDRWCDASSIERVYSLSKEEKPFTEIIAWVIPEAFDYKAI